MTGCPSLDPRGADGRVVHSFVQATVNIIIIRFSIFMIGSLVLIALAVHAAMAVGFANMLG